MHQGPADRVCVPTDEVYALLNDEMLYRKFREATARLEGPPTGEWPEVIATVTAPALAEMEIAEVLGT